MLGSGAILGAPSLPKFTTRPSSSSARDEGAPLLPSRRTAAPAEFRKSPRSVESVRVSPPRTTSASGSPRQAPVAVAGRSASGAPGRPAVPLHRIVESVPPLRPEKIARLHVDLAPDLRIEVSFRRGAVQGIVHAASEAARSRIESHLDRLRTMLEGKGIKVGTLRVVVSDSSSSETVSLPVSARVHLVDFLA